MAKKSFYDFNSKVVESVWYHTIYNEIFIIEAPFNMIYGIILANELIESDVSYFIGFLD